MNKTENQPSGDEHHLAAGEALQESLQLLVAFSHASALDFIIFDDQLRYRAVNNAAADTCGILPEHLWATQCGTCLETLLTGLTVPCGRC